MGGERAAPGPTRAQVSGRARVAVVMLVVCAVVNFAQLLLAQWPLSVRSRASQGELIQPSELTAAQTTILAALAFQMFAFIVTGVLFLRWLHGAHQRARRLGAGHLIGAFTPAWAVGCFFVPVANLVLPMEALRGLARASDPSDLPPRVVRRDEPTAGYREPAATTTMRDADELPVRVRAWWLTYLGGNLVAGAGLLFATTDPVLQVRLQQVSLVIGVAAAALAVQMVRNIDRRQVERALRRAARKAAKRA